MQLREFLDQVFLGNTVANYLWFFGILLFGYIFKKLLSKLLSEIMFRIVKDYSEDVTKAAFKKLLIAPLEFLTFLFFIYLAFNRLDYPLEWGAPAPKELGIKGYLLRTYQLFLALS
ncbi:MAG: hypothetical protein LPK19_09575, partial [Hymenobacteraceae bacterium]|nr:hypothetical protein [Hymenobacteraceae bacterium]MDX5396473.1 hypothetical protein [Hymenobacteraceae bacterium]MDX5512534.1 hypothetical protein [Hymenobacteraceae bacterium]